ncbi:MAG: type II secretion system protein N [Myxococcota bacterium]|jgi:general secretion pathway protein C|nr:type II secretion system protein N [Myxococcota bacterium]
MGPIGIRIINIVLFTTSCFFTAGVVNHIADHQLAPDDATVMRPDAHPETREPDWNERSAILDRNLFGAKVAGGKPLKKPEPELPAVEEAKETKLPIELLGTMAGEPAALSTAVISNTRSKKHQVVVIGDVLEGFDHVKVTSIEPRRVLLRNRSVIEELLLEKENGKKGRSASARAPGKDRDALSRLRARNSRKRANARRANVVSPANNDDANVESLKQMQRAMYKTLVRDLEPAYDDAGQITGVVAGKVEQGSVLARAGLEADDVITSLNGIDINSASAAARVLREMSKCKPMSGSVDGAGGTRTIEIDQDLLAALNCPN